MRNILVVDDNEEMLDAMEILISTFGFNVTVATSYDSLIKTFDEYTPDALLLDVILGLEDGREICKKLKADPKTSQIFIILISGKPDLLVDYKKFNADGILNKPFEIKEFQLLINNGRKIIEARSH